VPASLVRHKLPKVTGQLGRLGDSPVFWCYSPATLRCGVTGQRFAVS